MKGKDLLVAFYFPAEFCRLQFKRLNLRFKLRYLFIYRCQGFRILLLRLLDRLNQKWLHYRLLAMQTALKQILALFDYAEATRSRLFLWVAKILWVPIHFLCKLQHLTPETNKNSRFVKQPGLAQNELYQIPVNFGRGQS